MTDPTAEQIEAFLRGLAELSERTGVVVTGCTDGSCHCSMSLLAPDDRVARPVQYTHDRGCGPRLVDASPKEGGSQ